ncbi:MAG TPA: hypothetical protein VK327_05700, partial [Candidatus Paceibacterota bacterium]|nr:hypothetical protein [Candidatus Paceibacterota bacterium]
LPLVFGVVVAALAILLWRNSASKHGSVAPPANAPSQMTNEPAAATLPKLTLSESQRKAVTSLLEISSAISASLASDNLTAFNDAAVRLTPALQQAAEALGPDHSWTPLLQKVRETKLHPAGDLREARDEFISFSALMVEFVKVVRQQDSTSSRLKIYRCPMAPKPGYWMQLNGPLRNPYFGQEMIDCGSEIAP